MSAIEADGAVVPTDRDVVDSVARGSRRGWAALAIVTSLLYALPPLIMLAFGVSPVAVVTESLGYRYFNSLRLLEGERGLIFIVQGQTPGLVQHAINLALSGIGIPVEARGAEFTQDSVMARRSGTKLGTYGAYSLPTQG